MPADYYGVSCDYLLGRSMARDSSAVPARRMEGHGRTETEHNQIIGQQPAAAGAANRSRASSFRARSRVVFRGYDLQVYRYLYMADIGQGGCGVPRAPQDRFITCACLPALKEHELKIRLAAAQRRGRRLQV